MGRSSGTYPTLAIEASRASYQEQSILLANLEPKSPSTTIKKHSVR
jgi:hypothetical protein